MKILISCLFFLSFSLPFLYSQPMVSYSYLHFTIQVEDLSFKEDESNIQLCTTHPSLETVEAIQTFDRHDFIADKLHFTLTTSYIVGHKMMDTIAFELHNLHTGTVVNVFMTEIITPRQHYYFDLNTFPPTKKSWLYFDMIALEESLANIPSDSTIYWNGCQAYVVKDSNYSYFSSTYIKVLEPRGNHPKYSALAPRIIEKQYDNSYKSLNFETYFEIDNSSSPYQIIHHTHNSTNTIVAEYFMVPSIEHYKTPPAALYVSYTFYKDKTFKMEASVSSISAYSYYNSQVGVGIWEVTNGQLYLVTPPHWINAYNSGLLGSTAVFFPKTSFPYQIRGDFLVHKGRKDTYWKKKDRVNQRGFEFVD